MSPHSPTRLDESPSRRASFCQIALSPAVEFADRPNPAELRQDVLVKLLQREPQPSSCEALVDAEPRLTSVLYRNARADFFRHRTGRSKVHLVPIDSDAIEHRLVESEAEEDALLLDIDLLNRVRTLNQALIREIVETMIAAQRARRRGSIPSDLRQKIYRLRRASGLPLRTDLL